MEDNVTTKTSTPTKVAVSARIDEKLIKILDTQKKADRRNRSQQLEFYLYDYFEHKNGSPAKVPAFKESQERNVITTSVDKH